jgi:D-lactate dehydrogenase
MREGEVGGITSLGLERSRRSASIRARTEVSLLRLEKPKLLELMLRRPDLNLAALAFMGEKVRRKTRRLAGLLAGAPPDPRPRVAFFDTKAYDRASFEERVPAGLGVTFFETRLGPATASLADGHRVVCAFVNDDLGDATLSVLAGCGVELVALRCAGYNQVDLARAAALGLSVVRVPAYSPHAVAEHAVALLLTLNRKTHRAYNRVSEGNFSIAGLEGVDLHGRTAGIIGLGKIGRALARILRGFGMTVLAHDAFVDAAFAAEVGVAFVELEELLRRADVVSLHAPLTPETYHLIDARRLALMKRGATLLNTSRGGLVDAAALIEALKSEHLGAAGLDVYEEESGYFFEDQSARVIKDDLLARLLSFNNVLVTSHQAFLTEEALGNIADTTLASIAEFLAGKRGAELTHAVLPPGPRPGA